MKWVRFNYQGQRRYGLLNDASIQLTDHTWSGVLAGKPADPEGEIAQNEVTLLNPIERPGKIVCVGLNYLDHCRETNTPPPERPLVFTKFTTSANDPTGDIIWSETLTREVDDVLMTGTPHGVGLGREPQIYMQDGDVVVVEIEGIGHLENRCRIV